MDSVWSITRNSAGTLDNNINPFNQKYMNTSELLEQLETAQNVSGATQNTLHEIQNLIIECARTKNYEQCVTQIRAKLYAGLISIDQILNNTDAPTTDRVELTADEHFVSPSKEAA